MHNHHENKHWVNIVLVLNLQSEFDWTRDVWTTNDKGRDLFGYSAIHNFKMNCALLIAFNTN